MPGGERIMNPEPQVFLFLSDLLSKKVIGPDGVTVGKITDLVAKLAEPYPVVTHLLLKTRKGKEKAPSFLPWQYVTEKGSYFVAKEQHLEEYREPILQEGELLLKEAFLDKQIVDTNGAKVRRVNDLQFLKARNSLHLVHVDVGFRGLMRRVGLEKVMEVFSRTLFDYVPSDQFISWKYVQPLSSPDLLRLNISQKRLSMLRPADLADIIEDLDVHRRSAIFDTLDVTTAAETLEETDPKVQVSVIERMEVEKASDIIEEMSLDEAADLLGDLPKEKADDILMEMEKDIAEDVKELLAHPEEEAGGLMTSSFLSFAPSVTVGEALEHIRRVAEDMDFVYYLYVTDERERLLGMLSLRELLVAPSSTRLGDLMDTRVVSVSLNEEKDKIAERFAKYGVMALPVVDKNNRMRGVIMFKDLLEIIAPELGK